MVNLFQDPNILYLVLIFGLWVGVSATYIPGTGIKEAIAAVALIGAFWGLVTTTATNWWAVLLLIMGVLGFIIMPFLNNRFMNSLAIVGLALQGVGGLLLFNNAMVSPILLGVTLVLPLLYHRFVLLPVLRSVRERTEQAAVDTLLGARGRVVQPVNPIGTVQAGGELWTATSVDEKPIPSGEQVIVVERDGLQIVVESVKHKRNEETDSKEEKVANG